ncbi:hypothetical protein Y618_004152 [Salmonella enterica subsp. enterica]|nr:hypothetical protein [Salmonella enterica subsp. enterica]
MNVACDGPSGRGPWMDRVIRSQHISNLKYEGYITGKKAYRPGKINVCDLSCRKRLWRGGGGSYRAVTALFSEYPGKKRRERYSLRKHVRIRHFGTLLFIIWP